MTDLDLTEAIEAARRRMTVPTEAAYVTAAVAPVIERQVRERIAADIEAHAERLAELGRMPRADSTLRSMARIVRRGGGS